MVKNVVMWSAFLLCLAVIVFDFLLFPSAILVLFTLFLMFVFLLKYVRLRRYRVSEKKWFVVGYSVVSKNKENAQLHFLPPTLLKQQKQHMTDLQAFLTLRNFLQRNGEYGIGTVTAVTNIHGSIMKGLGFRRIAPASPFDWLSIAFSSWVATGKPNWKWPLLYKLEVVRSGEEDHHGHGSLSEMSK